MQLLRWMIPFIALAASPVGSAKDLSYALPASPIELVSNEEKFRAFAEIIRDDIERLLGIPAMVDDLPTLKMLLSSRVHLAHHFGDNDRAITTAAWIRSLQTEPTEKAFAGLTTFASVTARRECPGAAPDDAKYQKVFSREFTRQLQSLANTPEILAMLRRQREKIAGLSEAALLDETRRVIEPAISRRGDCGLSEADQIIRVRHRLVSILPVRTATLEGLYAAIQVRSPR